LSGFRIPIRAVTCWFPGGIMQWVRQWAEMRSLDLGPAQLTNGRSVPFRARRTAALIRTLAADPMRALKAIRLARAAARERAWELAGDDGPGADGDVSTQGLDWLRRGLQAASGDPRCPARSRVGDQHPDHPFDQRERSP
jgi:hypothetical protein